MTEVKKSIGEENVQIYSAGKQQDQYILPGLSGE